MSSELMSREAEVETNEFYEAFNQSLGVDGARKVINEAVLESGLAVRSDIPWHKAFMRICDVLRRKNGLYKNYRQLPYCSFCRAQRTRQDD